MTRCATCHGLSRVYSCDWWPSCGCPPGATLDGCNGASKPCPDCGKHAPSERRRPSPSIALPSHDDEAFGPVPAPAEVVAGLLLIAAIGLGAICFLYWLVT